MKRVTILTSAASVCAFAAGLWSIWPAFDGIFFTQAEASDVADTQRAINYQDRIDIAELHLKHETDEIERSKLQDEIRYYRDKIRQLEDIK